MNLTTEQEAIIEERLQGKSEDEMKEVYDEYIDDESNSEVNILGLTYSPSQVLKEIDPIAYRCYFNDWLDGMDLVEIDGYYYDTKEVEDLLEELAEEEEEELEEEETPT
jgi:methyl coenzyme M reductase subunit C-like uncharacterized protein (methanogenesis marker protein 7)